MSESREAVGLHEGPALKQPDSDSSFEDQCIDLLCKQENTLSMLGEASRKRRALDSLDLAKKMLLQFLDFAESHFDGVEIRGVGRRLYEVNLRTSNYEKMVGARSFSFLRRLIGMKIPNEDTMKDAHQQLLSDYSELYKEFFNTCAKRFAENSAIKEQFVQSVETFLNEFEEKW
jgi:hypothetical protein